MDSVGEKWGAKKWTTIMAASCCQEFLTRATSEVCPNIPKVVLNEKTWEEKRFAGETDPEIPVSFPLPVPQIIIARESLKSNANLNRVHREDKRFNHDELERLNQEFPSIEPYIFKSGAKEFLVFVHVPSFLNVFTRAPHLFLDALTDELFKDGFITAKHILKQASDKPVTYQSYTAVCTDREDLETLARTLIEAADKHPSDAVMAAALQIQIYFEEEEKRYNSQQYDVGTADEFMKVNGLNFRYNFVESKLLPQFRNYVLQDRISAREPLIEDIRPLAYHYPRMMFCETDVGELLNCRNGVPEDVAYGGKTPYTDLLILPEKVGFGLRPHLCVIQIHCPNVIKNIKRNFNNMVWKHPEEKESDGTVIEHEEFLNVLRDCFESCRDEIICAFDREDREQFFVCRN